MLVGIGVLVGTVGTASAEPSSTDWLRLRTCESGGNYAINTGNGYYGAYQFDLGTWRSVGGTGLPSNASPATQDALAYKLWQQRGWSPWTCARIVGLPAGGSGGPSGVTRAKAATPERTDGHLDKVTLSRDRGHLTVVGWAANLAAAGRSSSVRITVNGAPTVVRAASARRDVNRVMRVAGGHGFTASIPAVAGSYRVCVTALGKSSAHNKSLGCRTVKVPPTLRSWNRVKPWSGARAVVWGWTFDNTVANRSTKVIAVVNGHRTYTITANRASTDVNRAFKISGKHRYSALVWLGKGTSSVCVWAVGAGTTKKRFLGCTTIRK